MPVFVPFLSLVESGDGFPYEVLDDLGQIARRSPFAPLASFRSLHPLQGPFRRESKCLDDRGFGRQSGARRRSPNTGPTISPNDTEREVRVVRLRRSVSGGRTRSP